MARAGIKMRIGPDGPRCALPAPIARVAWPVAGVWLTLLGCTAASGERLIRADQLEAAPHALTQAHKHVYVADPAQLAGSCPTLGERVILIQARTATEWEKIRATMPEFDFAPDFSRGTLVGLAACAGTPLRNDWPVNVDAVCVMEGAGLVRGTFAGGTYFADDATYADIVFVEGLRSAVIVELNGDRFYPN